MYAFVTDVSKSHTGDNPVKASELAKILVGTLVLASPAWVNGDEAKEQAEAKAQITLLAGIGDRPEGSPGRKGDVGS
jgi:hypothetical protein